MSPQYLGYFSHIRTPYSHIYLCKRETNLRRGKMQTDTFAQLLKLHASKWCMEMHCSVQSDPGCFSFFRFEGKSATFLHNSRASHAFIHPSILAGVCSSLFQLSFGQMLGYTLYCHQWGASCFPYIFFAFFWGFGWGHLTSRFHDNSEEVAWQWKPI